MVVITDAAKGEWMDVPTSASYLGMTSDALRGLIKRRAVPFYKTPHGRLRCHKSELDAWVRGES